MIICRQHSGGKTPAMKNHLSDLNDHHFAQLDDKVRKAPNG
jgi:hypothetical protein